MDSTSRAKLSASLEDYLEAIFNLAVESQGARSKDIAEALGIGRQRYSNYEKGSRQVDLETLSKLANFFKVTTDYLLGNSEMRNWRIVTQDELDEFLPAKASEKIIQERLKILVDGQELDRQTREDIIRVLREKGYIL